LVPARSALGTQNTARKIQPKNTFFIVLPLLSSARKRLLSASLRGKALRSQNFYN
jgi:hypothetical protein